MRKVVLLSVAFHGCLAVAASDAGQPASGRELLDFVRDAHRASREQIRTAYCRVEFKATFQTDQAKSPVTQSCSAKYWFSRDAIRVQVSDSNEGDTDYLWKDSVRKSVVKRQTNGQPVVGAGLGTFPSRFLHRGDAFARGLLALHLPGTVHYVPFEQLLEQATRVKKVERKSIDDREMIVVALAVEMTVRERVGVWDVEIHFDPGVNHLVRKTIYTIGGLRHEDEVVRFKECAPGLFFPERVVRNSTEDGKPYGGSTTEFFDIRVNQPLPADIFQFRYPHGVMLTDTIRNTRYQVDSEGNPISKETAMGRGPPPPPLGEAAPRPGTESLEEPRSFTRWILPVSLGILGLAAGAAVLRRWRAVRAA